MLNFVSIIPYCPILSLEAWFVCVFFFLLIFSKTCVVCVFFFCEKKCRDIIMICGKSNWKLDLPLLIGKILFFQFLESTLMGGRDQKIKRFLLFFLVDQIIGIRWYVPFLRSCGCCCVVSPRHRLFARFLRYHGYDSRAFWPTREVHPERGEISNDQRTQSIWD